MKFKTKVLPKEVDYVVFGNTVSTSNTLNKTKRKNIISFFEEEEADERLLPKAKQ